MRQRTQARLLRERAEQWAEEVDPEAEQVDSKAAVRLEKVTTLAAGVAGDGRTSSAGVARLLRTRTRQCCSAYVRQRTERRGMDGDNRSNDLH